MIHPPALPSRRSIRLQGYDYSLPGDYFVTICGDAMRCLFGHVECGHVRLSPLGEMVFSAWRAIPRHYAAVELDTFVIMPNHLHGIVRLTRSDGPGKLATVGDNIQPVSLSTVIQRFKSLTATNYAGGAAEGHWPSYGAKLWQRGFYDRIIRDRKELDGVRTYIHENPLRWRAESGR